MSGINTFFADLQADVDRTFVYKPMTDEQYQISFVNDVQEWADKISSEWNGDEAGREEDRATIASEIIEKCAEIKELIGQLEEL